MAGDCVSDPVSCVGAKQIRRHTIRHLYGGRKLLYDKGPKNGQERKETHPGDPGGPFLFSGYMPAGSGTVSMNTIGVTTSVTPSSSDRCIMVESRGVEPLSESALEGPSPGADGSLRSLAGPRAVTLAGLVASLFMARAKLTARTSTTDRRPDRSRGPLRQDGR